MKRLDFKNVLMAFGWYSVDMHKGVARYAREHSWHLVLRNDYLRLLSLKEWRGNGVISCGYSNLDPFLKDTTLPVVTTSYAAESPQYQLVRENDHLIGQMAANHFMERGLRNFAKSPCIAMNLREKVFKKTLAENGFTYHQIPRVEAATANEELIMLGRALSRLPKPCGIFCENDLHAHDIIDAAFFLNYKIPEDIAILGVGNDPLICETSPVTLSSIDNRLEEVGYKAAAVLDKLMAGEQQVGSPIFIDPDPNVVVRESSDFFSVKNDNLKKVLSYMRNHSADNIHIESLSRKFGFSKSAMYKLFMRNIKRSPKQVLTDFRLENACRLLRNTSMKIDAISEEVGFPDNNAMYVAFRTHLGKRPGSWRGK